MIIIMIWKQQTYNNDSNNNNNNDNNNVTISKHKTNCPQSCPRQFKYKKVVNSQEINSRKAKQTHPSTVNAKQTNASSTPDEQAVGQCSHCIHFSRIHFFSFSPVMLYYSYTLMFSLVLQHCCYVVVCRFVHSLMAFVSQEIKGLLTYLLTSVADQNVSTVGGNLTVALQLYTIPYRGTTLI